MRPSPAEPSYDGSAPLSTVAEGASSSSARSRAAPGTVTFIRVRAGGPRIVPYDAAALVDIEASTAGPPLVPGFRALRKTVLSPGGPGCSRRMGCSASAVGSASREGGATRCTSTAGLIPMVAVGPPEPACSRAAIDALRAMKSEASESSSSVRPGWGAWMRTVLCSSSVTVGSAAGAGTFTALEGT